MIIMVEIKIGECDVWDTVEWKQLITMEIEYWISVYQAIY